MLLLLRLVVVVLLLQLLLLLFPGVDSAVGGCLWPVSDGHHINFLLYVERERDASYSGTRDSGSADNGGGRKEVCGKMHTSFGIKECKV